MGRVDWTKGLWNFISTGFTLDRLVFLMTIILDIESFASHTCFILFTPLSIRKYLEKKRVVIAMLVTLII